MSDERDPLEGRCGTCARFVRVIETVDKNGQVRRHGECLLGVWPAPLWETNTCSQYVRRGTFTGRAPEKTRTRRSGGSRPGSVHGVHGESPARPKIPLELPEELYDMNAEEFKEVLREVLRDELGVADVPIGQRWEGGEIVLKPGKEGTQEKRIPIDSLFSKIVMIRDRLRVLEQKVNAHPKLAPEEKVQMQQYITGCYGSLTTFNVLFANKTDHFVGSSQKGDGDE